MQNLSQKEMQSKEIPTILSTSMEPSTATTSQGSANKYEEPVLSYMH